MKYYALFKQEEWRKRYSATTATHLVNAGYSSAGDSINGEIVLGTKDADVPNERWFVVSIEPVTLLPEEHISDAEKRLIDERRSKDSQTTNNTGRKFR